MTLDMKKTRNLKPKWLNPSVFLNVFSEPANAMHHVYATLFLLPMVQFMGHKHEIIKHTKNSPSHSYNVHYELMWYLKIWKCQDATAEKTRLD